MKKKVLPLLLLLLAVTFGAYATQLTWDVVSNGTTIDDGAWTWKVWTSTFNNGSTSVVWADGNDVVIGNWWAGWTITVSGTVIPSSILFLPVSSNYTLSGGIITLPNANTSITTSWSASPTINSVISGTGWLLKLGAWTLTLGGTNTYTGNTTISEGKIIANNASAFGMTGSISVASWAILDISWLNFSGQDNIKSRTTIANGWSLITTLQTLVYDYESDVQWTSPANMQIEYTGLVRVGSISGVNGNGAYVYTNSWAQMPVSVLLTKFPSAADYSVTWLSAGSWTNYKNGMTLRAQPTPYYKWVYSWSRLWYLFQVASTGNTLKIYKITATTATQLVSATITAPASYVSRWYKARVVWTGLTFYYSDISSKWPWTQATTTTDATYAAWYTQYSDWWNSMSLKMGYIDDVTMQYQTETPVVPDKLSSPSPVSMGSTSATFAFTWSTGAFQYTLTANPWSLIVTWTTSPLTILWLTPGTTYAFTISAQNSAGSSIDSDSYTGTTSISSTINYSTTWATSGNVIATLTWLSGATITNNGWSNIYTFTWNGSFTFTFTQWASTWTATATVTWIDKTAPTATISYNPISATSGNVTAILTWFSEPIIITNNWWNTGYIFTDNGSFTFNFVDAVGNTGSATATVNNIDRIPPTWIISYSTTGTTNGNVIATLTWLSESVTITNNWWSFNYTFTDNGSFTFNYSDQAGNTWSAIATVNNIDKSWVYWTIAYSTTWATSWNVIATITLNKTGTITNNWWATGYIFTWNGSFTFTYSDQAGNTWSTIATVNNIDKVAPTWVISYSTTWITNGNVIATLTWLSESVTITNNWWSNSYTFTNNGTFTFNFIDAAGNTWSAIATVSWINTSLSLALTSPVQYQIFQRDISTNKWDIVIAGTYVGSFSGIEASWNGWSYQDISASMSWWIFTGKLTNQTGGQWSLTVRITSSTWVFVNVSDVWVWDIFIVAGQSNAVGQWFHNQIYTGTNGIKATLFGNDYTWKQLTDPYDSTSGQVDTVSLDSPLGWSFVPILATKIVASQNIPVAFVPTAKWGTHIWVWTPWVDHFDRTTLYGSMAYRIAQVWWKVAWVLWFQWETDVMMNRTTISYETLMNTIVTTLQSDFPSTAPIKFFVWSIGQDAYSWTAIDAMRKAQQEMYTINSNVYKSWPITYDIKLSDEWADTLHFKSDWDLAAFTERWWNAISREYYGIASLWSPRVVSTGVVLYTSWNNLLVPFDTALATQVPMFYTNNLSGTTYLTWSAWAFTLSGSQSVLGVKSVSLSWTNSLILSLSGSYMGDALALNYANWVLWVNTAVYSSWTYQPAYPIYGASVTVVDNSAPIITLNWSGVLMIAQWSTYNDAWSLWTDNFDGSGSVFSWSWWATGSFAVSWSVNTNIPGTYYIQYNKVDSAGNSSITTRTINIIDSTPVAWTIVYSTTWATSGNVIATVSLNKSGSITNNSWSTFYTFTWNGSFTFTFVDLLWGTWSATATVNNIDKVAPTGVINYSTTNPTSWNVIVALTWLSESVTITNNWWSANYTFTWNGTFTFNFRDAAGNTWSAIATVNNIDKGWVSWTIAYNTTWATSWNVIATITLNKTWTITNNWWSANYTFTWNGSFTFNYSDQAGNTWSTIATVNNIDKVAPTWVISYSTTWITNGNVIATLTWLSESVTITNNWWIANYTFINNGTFTFTFADAAGNTWSTIATVNNIDKVVPTWVINYSTTNPTSWNVIATLTWLNKSVTITNNGWSANYTFTSNWIFAFNFIDAAWNTWSTIATVNNIDKVAPTWVISYSTTWTTNGNVIVTLTWLSESVTITNNWWSNSYTFINNGTFTFTFADAAGNTWSATATVNNIDKSWIYWTINYTTTWMTNSDVIATITLNKTWTITNNWWSANYTFTWNGSFTFNYSDQAGNTWSTIATVNNIDKVAPTWVISYSTTWITNGNVIATLTWLSKSVTITNNWWSANYTFTWNGTFTFNFRDAAGNTWSAIATVNNIDKGWVSWTIAYNTTWATSWNVIATITLNKTWTITNNWWSANYTFTWNGSFTFNYSDQAGNTWSTIATVNNIDKVAPTWVISYSTTWITNGNVIATLTWLSESVTITNNWWIANYTFTNNGTFTFNFVDLAGNTWSAIATVNNIDNTPLPIVNVIVNTWSSVSAFTWWWVILTGTTATWATFWWTGEIIIYARNSSDNSLSFATSGASITASWRDSALSAPTLTTDTWTAQFWETWVPSQDTSTMTREILTTIKAWSDTSSLYITGTYFKISYKVDAWISGNILKIIRSEDGNTRESNTPDAQCILDANKICTFNTDRLSYFATIKETTKQISSGWWWGWGGWWWGWSLSPVTTTPTCWLADLVCVNNSYQKKSWASCNWGYEWTICTTAIVSTGIVSTWTKPWLYSAEEIAAYLWALYNWITTKPTIQAAKMDGSILRRDLAKMIAQYAVNVLKKDVKNTSNCVFLDVPKDKDLLSYVNTVCQLWLMGKNTGQLFDPGAIVTRAQFWTILSRLLRWSTFDGVGDARYKSHLMALQKQWIMTKIDIPTMHEKRWLVMLMLYRTSK